MLFSFIKYFFHYIFFTKTRQRLLFLAMGGLILSSFSLLVLQSIMGGLQKGLISRSKKVDGLAIIMLNRKDLDFAHGVLRDLRKRGFEVYPEYEMELLLRFGQFLSPVAVHGVDEKWGIPPHLRGKWKGSTLMGIDLAHKMGVEFLSEVTLISPSHVRPLLGDVPQQISTSIGDTISTNIPEVDLFHLWTRLSLIHNLIRDYHINRLRFFSGKEEELQDLKEDLQEKYGDDLILKTWEEQNSSLVWALNLETTVMVFLFVAMTFLVAITITSGFMIFFDKIKQDLISFWILGASQKKIRQCCVLFIHFISFFTTSLGLVLGALFLFFLDHFGPDIMPDIFVDRKIPVSVTWTGVALSFFVPYFISATFSHFSLRSIQRDKGSYLDHIRAVG